ncbi:MAG: RluA family pseudouridine synthase [Candidatus Dormibacteria bacterium]
MRVPDLRAAAGLRTPLPARLPGRLDLFLAVELELGRAAAQRLVRQGRVAVGDEVEVRPSRRLRPGELVQVLGEVKRELTHAEDPPPRPRLVFQDESLAVVDKPAGLVVHPGRGHTQGTLAQMLEGFGGEWSRLAGEDRPGIVHRLDKGTSGLLVLARTESAHAALARQLWQRTLGREYWALVRGRLREDRGRIEAAVGRDPGHPGRIRVGPLGREAVTEFEVLERFAGSTALRLQLLTGRTHQIRVHLAYIGRPLVGDELYGGPPAPLGGGRPALHAAMLHLRHPEDLRELRFVSPLPEDLLRLRRAAGGSADAPPRWPWPAPTPVAP